MVLLGDRLFSISLPVTGVREESAGSAVYQAQFLPNQVERTQTNKSQRQVTRLTVNDNFSYPVVEQPMNNPGYVSSAEKTLTHFRLANDYGSTGILAHNHLAGARFFDIKVGDTINIADAEGKNTLYVVFSIRQFQAASPTSAYSNFIDLVDNKVYTATELFLDTYGNAGYLVLQTCLERDGVDSWGRYFVLALPFPTYFQMIWPNLPDQATPPL